MNAKAAQETIPPPRLIASLRAGFDTVATHIGLILFPVVLDLFLWFGPHYQLKTIFQAVIRQTSLLPRMDNAQMGDLIEASQEFWKYMADHFNLASALRTFPIGIPSLMSSRFPVDTPLGQPVFEDLGGLGGAVMGWLLFTLIGLVFGSLYFSSVSAAVANEPKALTLARDLWAAVQSIILSISWLVLLIAVTLPAIFLLSLLALVSPGIAQFATILFTIILAWVIVPLLFSPHGIFVYRQNAFLSLLTSVRLVRFILPGTGLFFLSILLLSQGLDLLWQVPPANSWFSLVGITGHAFITTALVAASFIYYRDAMRWVQDFLQRKLLPQAG